MPIIVLLPKAGAAATASIPTPLVEMDIFPIYGGGFTLDDPVLSLLDMGIPLDFADPSFTEDITPYVRGFSVDRGASSEIESVEAGTFTIELDNRDGRFTPFNPASPYYPNILPMRRIRIRALWDSNIYPVCMGYIEEWPYTFPEEMDATVTVQLVDGFDLLGSEGVAVSGDFPQQQSGERVAAILEAAGWPPNMTAIQTGVVTVPAITLENAGPLAHIQEIEFAEQGRFFMDREGKATFRQRSSSTLIAATWADDGTGLPYRSSIQPRFSRTHIKNDIRLTRPGGIEQVIEDAASRTDFGQRSFVREVQLASDIETLSLAEYLLVKGAQPQLRLESIEDLAMRHLDWGSVLDRELVDTIKIIESRMDIAQVSAIQRRHDEYDGESWSVSFQVSPTVVENYARLDDPAFRLDDNFILGR